MMAANSQSISKDRNGLERLSAVVIGIEPMATETVTLPAR